MIVAVVDACVLYSAPLRDLLMHLTAQFLLQPKWTKRSHDEWIENLLERRPDLDRTALERTRDLMNHWARDWRVPRGKAPADSLALPDPDDQHVLTAAIAANARIIMTFNLSDFPARALAPHGIRAAHPDTLLCELFDSAPEPFLEAARAHRAALRHPLKSINEYLSTLASCGLPRLSERLTVHGDVI